MADKIFIITGSVTNSNDRTPVTGLTIEVWQKSPLNVYRLGTAVTEGDTATYKVTYTDVNNLLSAEDGTMHDTYIKIFYNDIFVTRHPKNETQFLPRLKEGTNQVDISVDIREVENPVILPGPVPVIDITPALPSHFLLVQLRNTVTNSPIPGYKIDMALVQNPKGGEIEEHFLSTERTNQQGYFNFVINEFEGFVPVILDEQKYVDIRFNIYSLTNEEMIIKSLEQRMRLETQNVFQLLSNVLEKQPDTSPTIENLDTTTRSGIDTTLKNFLEERNITTLKAIRQAGLLKNLEGLPVVTDSSSVRLLQAHANLNTISDDIEANQRLIDKGYDSVYKIATTTRAQFVSDVNDDNGNFKSALVHHLATHQIYILNNILVAAQADAGLKSSALPMQVGSERFGNVSNIASKFAKNLCSCEECKAGVSPLAYLADLLSYTLQHVMYQPDSDPPTQIELAELTTIFHQPFGSLPISCSQLHDEVCQVRLCIEVLRSYIAAHALPPNAKLMTAQRSYREATYYTLLNKLGTSFDELRASIHFSDEEKKRLADRLGVDVDFPVGDPLPEHPLEVMLLDPAQLTGNDAITEANLEIIFGFRDTTRSPLTVTPVSKLEKWRRAHLRNLWKEADKITNEFYLHTRPVIDPDLISPDDLRISVQSPLDPLSPVFLTWLNRRRFVDDIITNSTFQNGFSDFSRSIGHDRGARKFYVYDADLTKELFPSHIVSTIEIINSSAIDNYPSNNGTYSLFSVKRVDTNTEIVVSDPIPSPTGGGEIKYKAQLKIFDVPATNTIEIEGDIMLQLNTLFTYEFFDNQNSTIPHTSTLSQISVNIGSGNTILSLTSPLPSISDFISGTFCYDKQAGLGQFSMPDINKMIEQINANPTSLPPYTMYTYTYTYTNQSNQVVLVNDSLPVWSYLDIDTSTWITHDLQDIKDIYSDLTGTDTSLIQLAVETIRNQLHLSVESFSRFISILFKSEDYVYSPSRNPAVSEDEWQEVYSILTHAAKVAFSKPWSIEEENRGIEINPSDFWISLTEPKEGIWSPVLDRHLLSANPVPLIEPELISLADLPDRLYSTYLDNLVDRWNNRKTDLEIKYGDIEALNLASDNSDFINMLKHALDVTTLPLAPAFLMSIYFSLEDLLNALNAPDAFAVKAASVYIEQRFYMNTDEFRKLMSWKVKFDDLNPDNKPTQNELKNLYAFLTSIYKRAVYYTVWIAEENSFGLSYWTAYKANLPKWRADATARNLWQQAIQICKQIPVIDPDLVCPGDIRFTDLLHPDDTYNIWYARKANAPGNLGNLFNTINSEIDQNSTGVELGSTIESRIGCSTTEFENLAVWREQGMDIRPRLEQLDLTNASYDYLKKIYDMTPSSVLDGEWIEVTDIFVQAEKKRNLYYKWIRQEQNDEIIITPYRFQLTNILPTNFPLLNQPELKKWRATRKDRKNWLSILEARTEQNDAIASQLKKTIEDVEDITLKVLRDALVNFIIPECITLDEKGKQLSKLLLIDAQNNCCSRATRVSQAIETLQQLLWSLRTGIFTDIHSDLALDADYFDEEWQWIGSYATWRAAMFVFMFPENLLSTNLRRENTTKLKSIIKEIRSSGSFTDKDACAYAHQYAEYLQDISSLEVEATCQTKVKVKNEDECCDAASTIEKTKLFLFGRAVSGKVYFSTYDPDNSAFKQSDWKLIPQVGKIIKIVGAQVYAYAFHRYIVFIFHHKQDYSNSLHQFIKYNLDTFMWDEEATDLEFELPDGAWEIQPAVTKQSFDENSPPSIAIRYAHWTDNLQAPNSLFYNGAGINRHFVATCDFKMDLSGLNKWVHRSSFSTYRDAKIIGFYQFAQNAKMLAISYKDDIGNIWTVFISANGDVDNIVGLVGGGIMGKLLGMLIFNNGNDMYFYMISRFDPQIKYQLFQWPSPNDFVVAITNSVLFGDSFNTMASYNGKEAGNNDFEKRYFTFLNKGFFNLNYIRNLKKNIDNTLTLEIQVNINPHNTFPEVCKYKQDSTEAELSTIKFEKWNSYMVNSVLHDNLRYIKEAQFFLPLFFAFELCKRGNYQASLDWYRSIYNWVAPVAQRKMYHGLVLEETFTESFSRLDTWLLDPLNPHSLAVTRKNAYTKFVIMSIVQCMMKYADSEFTFDTSESIARARNLYLQALDLLDAPEIKKAADPCEEQINCMETATQIDLTPFAAVWTNLQSKLLQVGDSTEILLATALIENALASNEDLEKKMSEVTRIVNDALADVPEPVTFEEAMEANNSMLNDSFQELLSDMELSRSIDTLTSQIANEYTGNISIVTGIESGELVNRDSDLNWLSETTQALIATENNTSSRFNTVMQRQKFDGPGPINFVSAIPRASQLTYIPIWNYNFCVPVNIAYSSLRLHAELNLYKIHNCRNIAGIKRELEPYAAATDTTTGLPMLTANGDLSLQGIIQIRPTQYRYKVLIERAKQIVSLSQQMEATFLSFLEKRDAEYYALLKARQDLQTANAGIRLQDLRIKQAQDEVALAQLQEQKAQFSSDHFQQLIDEGYSEWEKKSIDLLYDAVNLFEDATFTSLLPTVSITNAVPTVNLPSISSFFSTWAQMKSAKSSLYAQLASFERRAQEWQFQKALSYFDIRLADQQVKIAEDGVKIIGQERVIAVMQSDHAKAVVDFLSNKFTNVELYDWMSGVLQGVYAFFLNQSTAVAKMAERQLAFDRQETPAPPYIQDDYWNPADDNYASGDEAASKPDRKGMTGSARLLQDIYQLDQYAFTTDKRKLQLSKTFSLAQLFPIEFQQFRETGVMTFQTLMDYFNHDFPGHYLRLVKQVKTSVIALIPPVQGIKASLTSTGISYAVIGADVFQRIPIRRDPETVALTGAMNATGIFDLQAQPEFLNPFEGSGVESTWEFKMPKAANFFDYSSIADVLVTVDYTALQSYDYERIIIQELDSEISSDMALSFKNNMPDQWYDFNNPDLSSTPMMVKFTTSQDNFPANIKDLRIQHLTLYFARADEETFGLAVDNFTFKEKGTNVELGGPSGFGPDGNPIISTRTSSGNWVQLIGKSPFGEWTLKLPDTTEVRSYFKDEKITDIIFVITYKGETHPWPV